jgi:hypothetical protein
VLPREPEHDPASYDERVVPLTVSFARRATTVELERVGLHHEPERPVDEIRPSGPAVSEISSWGRRSSPGTSTAMARGTDSKGFAARPLASRATRRHWVRPVVGTCSARASIPCAVRSPWRNAESATLSASSSGRLRALSTKVAPGRSTPSDTSSGSRSRHLTSAPTRLCGLTRRLAGTETQGRAGGLLSSQPRAAAALSPDTTPLSRAAARRRLVRRREGVVSPRIAHHDLAPHRGGHLAPRCRRDQPAGVRDAAHAGESLDDIHSAQPRRVGAVARTVVHSHRRTGDSARTGRYPGSRSGSLLSQRTVSPGSTPPRRRAGPATGPGAGSRPSRRP